MASTFGYKPLNDPSHEIRLLRIQSKEPMICYTSVHNLADAPTYRAISYTWGDAHPLQNITLDDQPFAARLNCVLALSQAYQHLTPDTLLWNDAICINQQDIAEKGRQVAIMGRIYREAETVFASVGRQYGDSDFLYRIATDLHAVQTIRNSDECADCYPAYHSQRPVFLCTSHARQSWAESLDLETYTRLRGAYQSFAHRPYWRRMWIMQETTLARRNQVACGDRVEYMDILACLSDLFVHADDWELSHMGRLLPTPGRRDYNVDQDHFGFVLARRGMYERPYPRQKMRSFSIVAFLHQLKDLKCADVRDRIYGLLELVDWRQKGPPQPNYGIDPFCLVLEVINIFGAYDALSIFEFPYSVSALLAAMEIGPCTTQAAGDNRDLENLPIDWTLRSSTADEQAERRCCCTEPCAPEVGLLKFVSHSKWAVLRHGRETTDSELETSGSELLNGNSHSSLVGHLSASNSLVEDWQSNTTRQSLSPPDTEDRLNVTSPVEPSIGSSPIDSLGSGVRPERSIRKEAQRILFASGLEEHDVLFSLSVRGDRDALDVDAREYCLVFRQRHDQYYELLPRLVEVPSAFFRTWRCDSEPPELRSMWLCLDVEDAAVIALAYDESKRVMEPGDPGESIILRKNLCRLRASSFAFWTLRVDDVKLRDGPPTLAGVPSVDDRFIICAQCGGLFEPRLFESA